MVRVEDQRVCRYELKRILILLFAAHFIRRAELFQDGRRKPDAFFHFGGNDHALPLQLRHFRTDVPLAACRQGIGRDAAAVAAKDAGQGIPVGRLAVAAVAVRDDQGFYIDFADSHETADFLGVVDERRIAGKELPDGLFPNSFPFDARVYRGTFRDEVRRSVFLPSPHPFPQIICIRRGVQQEFICIQCLDRHLDHGFQCLQGRQDIAHIAAFQDKLPVRFCGKVGGVGFGLLFLNHLLQVPSALTDDIFRNPCPC